MPVYFTKHIEKICSNLDNFDQPSILIGTYGGVIVER